MANITFQSPIMQKAKTVYAVAGNTKTILALAEEHKIPIPFECGDGDCGSCLIEVSTLDDKPKMGMALTEKEKARLKELQKITPQEIENAETSDIPPRYRLACQYIARDEDVIVRFSGTPGGSS
ncbi:2Fe-2S iron-sulfur cluster binding domain-containing protein [Roseibacterium beibuensis]|uniref:2Fe-2S iron-sulfur cluster-binding protein n=1 Tax=[Roseibacterium] beibuensis TaxID=1193142 RepID=A0ABP9LFA8_9RHOB|nr:2Fe-2S iron-sulfur cluster binding domain-containing protein [Roseibacterium beibuensis]MCS6623540.1 2Fe-2S iron-sulfur cluster binding domain-containing protein [Roseibacterium beibuensis]